MKIVLERPGKAEPDLELIWFLVLAAGGVMTAAWLLSPFPAPGCPLRELTGWPCPTCGGTRSVRSLFEGNFAAAWTWNPLVFTGAFAAAGFVAYVAAVLLFRLPRIRVRSVSRRASLAVRLGIAALVAINWLYLIVHFARLPAGPP